VALAFIPNNNISKTEVNHIDEDKHNNTVENLEWCDRDYNNRHGTRIERAVKHGWKGDNSKKVRCVENGMVFDSLNKASEWLGISAGHICKCCQGKRKTCGGFHWEYID
jgi:hypothetical protein